MHHLVIKEAVLKVDTGVILNLFQDLNTLHIRP
jgi:hypothetical protein